MPGDTAQKGITIEVVVACCSFSRDGRCTISAGSKDYVVTPEMLEIREELQEESGK